MKEKKKIARDIVLAQVASDAGKNIFHTELNQLEMPSIWEAENEGYANKDKYILRALDRISKNPNTGFKFSVKELGFDRYIVYFSFKINEKKYQVSFHSFERSLLRFAINSAGTRWDKKSSRDACVALAHAYNL